MKKYFLFSLLLTAWSSVFADRVVRELGRINGEPEPYVLPYGFASEAMGFVVGVAGGISGLPQEQNSLIATALLSNEGAAAVYVFFNNYQLASNSHLFMDVSLGLGEFPQQRAYLDTSPPGNQPPAGSNDSSPNNFFDADGFSNWIEVDFKYVFDIGNAKSNPVNTYTLSEGLLVGGASGGEVFNPFKSGRTYFQTTIFHHNRDYEVDSVFPLSTTGIGFSFKYDNTDFPINPNIGSIIDVGIKYDPGFDENEQWSVAEIEYSKFFNFGSTPFSEQQVIAFNVWTANTLSDGPPPHYYGITLGGLYRLRAYPIERFHDNSAIYYSTEFRTIPKSDLLRKITFLEFANLEWWEIAIFYEIGRVAPNWDLKELHTDMKQDIGVSLRIMANNDIGRLDIAWSEEDTAIWLMYGHPF
jgi:surface antigen Omp85-like protein